MLFSVDARPGLADGSITRTVRRWSRAQVRAGGAYRVLGLRLVVHTVEHVTVEDLTAEDAQACGWRVWTGPPRTGRGRALFCS